MNTIAWLGRLVIERVKGIGAASLMLIQILFSMPSKGGFQRFIYQMYRVGVMSLLIISVSGLFIGLVLGLQGYSILVNVGSEAMLGTMVSLTLLRELAPVVAALLFAGRAGSALTAEIGSMKQSEQLASMEMIGVDFLGVDEGSFWGGMQSSVQFGHDVVNGIIKSVVFALICTWVAVYQGYACDPTPEGIATSMTRTVVYSSLCVLGFDFVLTAVMFGGI